MTFFCDASSLCQTFLLVVSQFAVITLVSGFVLLFGRKAEIKKQIGIGAALLLNTVLYILMYIDSHTPETEQGIRVCVPDIILMLTILLSIAYCIWVVLSETGNRKTISHTSIKESFDNLPTGVCFFNEAGLPVLCNRAMYRFCFAVSGKDVQFVTDLEECLADGFAPLEGVVKDGSTFVFPDGKAWHLEKRHVVHEDRSHYTQYNVSDITDLHNSRIEIQKENDELRKVQNDLKKLSANVVAATREEEILNTKMRVHDEMGRCLMSARKYLRDGVDEDIPESVINSWRRAVSMLKYNNDTQDEDMLSQIRKTCEQVNLSFVQKGELPKDDDIAYILTCAVRECLTNAVRYAAATELYASFTENETEATVAVTNNGKPPENEIKEGGGLSTLRRRVEKAGGIMSVQSFPYFRLTVTLIKGKEGVL